MTKLSAPPTQSLASPPQNQSLSHSLPANSQPERTTQSSPSHTPDIPPQLKDSLEENIMTVTDKDEGPNTTLSQNVPLYAVPDKLRMKVRNCENVCLVFIKSR